MISSWNLIGKAGQKVISSIPANHCLISSGSFSSFYFLRRNSGQSRLDLILQDRSAYSWPFTSKPKMAPRNQMWLHCSCMQAPAWWTCGICMYMRFSFPSTTISAGRDEECSDLVQQRIMMLCYLLMFIVLSPISALGDKRLGR